MNSNEFPEHTLFLVEVQPRSNSLTQKQIILTQIQRPHEHLYSTFICKAVQCLKLRCIITAQN